MDGDVVLTQHDAEMIVDSLNRIKEILVREGYSANADLLNIVMNKIMPHGENSAEEA